MRYIDVDMLIEALREDYDREGAKADDMAIKGLADASVKYSHGQFCFLNAIERVKDTPTADVVPKSEVEKIFEEIERFLYLQFRFCKEEIGNDDTEYVKGRMELNTQIQNFIAELKKKYTKQE